MPREQRGFGRAARHCDRRSRAVWALLALSGCLPEAGPGIGERILAGRGMSDVTFAPSDSNDPPLLFTRETTTLVSNPREFFSVPRDLFALSRGAEPMLVAQQLEPFGGRTGEWDGRGRRVVSHAALFDAERRLSFELTIFDPRSGRIDRVGRARSLATSPDGDWLVYEQIEGGFVARSLDDRVRPIEGKPTLVGFVGGALLFVANKTLQRLAPEDDAPQAVASDVANWLAVPGRPATLMLARRTDRVTDVLLLDLPPTSPPRLIASSVVRTELVVSADGRRLALVDQIPGGNQIRLRLLSVESGQERSLYLDVPPIGGVDALLSAIVSFRPGTDEVWCFVNQRLYVILGDAVVTVVDGRMESSRGVGREVRGVRGAPVDGFLHIDRAAYFTSDGKRWIFRASDGKNRLGDADHPEDERGVAVSSDDFYDQGDIVELAPGGPLAILIRPPGGGRQDLYLVEPPFDSRRLVVRNVSQMVFGSGRILAVVRKIGGEGSAGTGDMVLVDLADGTETLLARNVVNVALAWPCAGCDPLAPGTTLSYVVQARVPFPYDGLWMGTVP